MRLYLNETKNVNELKEVLKGNNEIPNKYEVSVIVYAFDDKNRIIFQRRGLGCRDERLKLETIGGRVKEDDIDFKSALRREIIEEVGTDADIEIDEFVTSTFAKTFDFKNNQERNWIYLTYKGTLKNGELKIAEPTKNLGYERYKIGEIDKNELSNGAREIYEIISEKYSYLK